jgi:hypothetical protein
VIDDALPALRSLPSDAGFYQNNADVYGVSWLAVRFLVRRIGLKQVADLYEDMGAHGIDQTARDRILLTRSGLTEATLWIALQGYQPQR